MNYPLRCDDPTATDIVCDDQVILTLQYSTQWDSLAHVGQMFDADGDGRAEDVFYNGYRAGRDIIGPAYYDAQGNMTPCDEPQGARHLGVQNMAEACMQGRGVLIDLEAHFGRTGHIVSYDELDAGDAQGQRHRRTRRLRAVPHRLRRDAAGDEQAARPREADGRHGRPRRPRSEAAAMGHRQWRRGADLRQLRGRERCRRGPCLDDVCATLPLHAHCLFKLGCYLGEMFYLTELADWLRANNRSRFLFTGPPLRLPGAVGSPATPVATV